jgi:hypothetical protein
MPIFYDPINLATNQLEQARIENLGSDPGTGVSGQIYYNTSTDKLKFYDGSINDWANIGGGSAANDYLTGLSFNTADGVLTATVQNQSNVTVDLDGRYALTGDIGDGTLTVQGTGVLGGTGTFTANQAGNTTISVTHDSFSDSQTTAASTLTFGGTFQAYTDVTSNSTGHVTGHELTTFTLPAAPTDVDNYVDSVAFSTTNGVLTLGRTGSLADLSVDLDGRYLESNETITLSGDVTGSGTTAITTTISVGAVDFAMINPVAVVTETEGIANNDNDVTLPTSAAVKAYADSLIVGGLIYQGGYNANTNSPNLDASPNPNLIKKGWTYTVTDPGMFFTEQVRAGDVLIAESDAPTVLTDWTTVQNNIDLADLTTVGIGNVNASIANTLDGLNVSYSSGTATVGLDVVGLTELSDIAGGDSLIIYDLSGTKNYKVSVGTLNTAVNSASTYATTISATATITHGLNTKDVIVQLYDTVTNLTVYARVNRISTSQATITFGTTPANDVRVLIQKIG